MPQQIKPSGRLEPAMFCLCVWRSCSGCNTLIPEREPGLEKSQCLQRELGGGEGAGSALKRVTAYFGRGFSFQHKICAYPDYHAGN